MAAVSCMHVEEVQYVGRGEVLVTCTLSTWLQGDLLKMGL